MRQRDTIANRCRAQRLAVRDRSEKFLYIDIDNPRFYALKARPDSLSLRRGVDGLINTSAQEEFRYRNTFFVTGAIFYRCFIRKSPGIFHPGHDFSTVESPLPAHPEAGDRFILNHTVYGLIRDLQKSRNIFNT
jgi:hypothetical protein